MEVLKMDSMIAIRVNEKEKKIINKISKLNNCGVSSWIKRVIYEYIENEFDIAIINEYERDKKDGKVELKPIENLFSEYGI